VHLAIPEAFERKVDNIQSDLDVAICKKSDIQGHVATREFPELVDYWNMVL